LVGALQACYLAKRGYHVDLYELREDIRQQDVVRGRSINLALSKRGRDALADVGLEDTIVEIGTPMHSRMIHDLDGTRRPIPYGKEGQAILSIDRRYLNEVLLTAAETHTNVKTYFNQKLARCDLQTGECEFESNNDGSVTKMTYDLVVGCDGAYSSLRRQIMRSTRLDYQQQYIPHGYMELKIPATNGEYTLEENYLHIWARETFMMIGLPDKSDKSFVLTLFMPFEMFEKIKTEEELMSFFHKTFPDSIPLIGKEELINTYFNSKALPMVCVKCSPYHVGDKAVILGDAAHALVPFYGQGMNCGFEDCIVFNDLMDKHNDDLGKVLSDYSEQRAPDAHAIVDLALRNYIEMRSSVNSTSYLLRKKVDNVLNSLFPRTWTPLYTMVTFTRIRYSECISFREWQDKVLSRAILVGGVGVAAGSIILAGYISSKTSSGSQVVDAFMNTRVFKSMSWAIGRTLFKRTIEMEV